MYTNIYPFTSNGIERKYTPDILSQQKYKEA